MPFFENGANPNPELVARQNEAEKLYWSRHQGVHGKAHAPPRRTDSVRYPDFFVLGAQKGGTTWLMNQLMLHPQLWCPIVKELFYFDEFYSLNDDDWAPAARLSQLQSTLATSDLLPYQKPYLDFADSFYREASLVDDRWYSRNFAHGGANQFVGDAVITFPLLPLAAIAHMRRLSPHAKCIFLIRDPFERAWSHLRMLLPADDRSPQTQMRIFNEQRDLIRAMTDYPAIRRRILAGFPNEQVLFLDYGDIARAPRELLRAVCAFLGVPFEEELFPYVDSVVFKGPDAEQDRPVVEAIRELTNPVSDACKTLFPKVASGWPSTP